MRDIFEPSNHSRNALRSRRMPAPGRRCARFPAQPSGATGIRLHLLLSVQLSPYISRCKQPHSWPVVSTRDLHCRTDRNFFITFFTSKRRRNSPEIFRILIRFVYQNIAHYVCLIKSLYYHNLLSVALQLYWQNNIAPYCLVKKLYRSLSFHWRFYRYVILYNRLDTVQCAYTS